MDPSKLKFGLRNGWETPCLYTVLFFAPPRLREKQNKTKQTKQNKTKKNKTKQNKTKQKTKNKKQKTKNKNKKQIWRDFARQAFGFHYLQLVQFRSVSIVSSLYFLAHTHHSLSLSFCLFFLA